MSEQFVNINQKQFKFAEDLTNFLNDEIFPNMPGNLFIQKSMTFTTSGEGQMARFHLCNLTEFKYEDEYLEWKDFIHEILDWSEMMYFYHHDNEEKFLKYYRHPYVY